MQERRLYPLHYGALLFCENCQYLVERARVNEQQIGGGGQTIPKQRLECEGMGRNLRVGSLQTRKRRDLSPQD